MEKRNLIYVLKDIINTPLVVDNERTTLCAELWGVIGTPLCNTRNSGMVNFNCNNCPLIATSVIGFYKKLWILKL